jgi:hypothetical protein
MKIEKAVANAIENVNNESGKSIAQLSEYTSKPESFITKIYSIISGKVKRASINSIHEFCCATGYTLEEFFARKEFDDLE